jgi:type VI secretion system VasD/TssJ family lipoprotein
VPSTFLPPQLALPHRAARPTAPRSASRLLHLSLLVLACKPADRSAPPCAHPPRLQLSAVAAPQLNLSPGGEPWPLHLRLYQLAGAPRRPPGIADLRADDGALGVRVLAREDRVIYPGEHTTWLIDQDPAATHIAALALFRQPGPAGWFQALPLPGPSACTPAAPCLRLTLGRNLLTAAPHQPTDDPDAPQCAPWALQEPSAGQLPPPKDRPSLPNPPPSPPSAPPPPSAPL